MRAGMTALLRTLAAAAIAAAPFAAAAKSCSVAPGLMSFGLYDTILATSTDTTVIVLVSCTPGLSDPLTTPYTITIAGTGNAGDTVRAVSNGSGSQLYYQMYKDAARSVVWGNGGSSGSGVTGSVTSSAPLAPAQRMHSAYARMPGRQNAPPGIYSGTLLVTVDY